MYAFWDALDAFGNLLADKMDAVGLEFTIWFWILLACGIWLHNAREWVRAKARKRRQVINAGIRARAEEKED